MFCLNAAADAAADLPGEEVGRWKRAYRVQDLAVAAGGGALVIAASDKHIHILRCVLFVCLFVFVCVGAGGNVWGE
jgi:hypothetical protein